MKIDGDRIYAVITGDIVDSTSLAPQERKQLNEVMNAGSKALKKEFGENVPLAVDVFRGDGWQFLVTEPAQALRLGLFYRAYLKANMVPANVDTRLVISLGRIDFIPGVKVSQGSGEAFVNSGRTLENLKRTRMGFVAPGVWFSESLDIVLQLVDAIASHWSDKRARAVQGALLGWSQLQIATLWEPLITQQAVAEHLEAADWRAVSMAISYFERAVSRQFP